MKQIETKEKRIEELKKTITALQYSRNTTEISAVTSPGVAYPKAAKLLRKLSILSPNMWGTCEKCGRAFLKADREARVCAECEGYKHIRQLTQHE